MPGSFHRCCDQLPDEAGGGLAGAAALTKPQSRVRPMTLLFFRCSVLTRSLTRRRQDPGLDNASAIEPSGPPSAELGGALQRTFAAAYEKSKGAFVLGLGARHRGIVELSEDIDV